MVNVSLKAQHYATTAIYFIRHRAIAAQFSAGPAFKIGNKARQQMTVTGSLVLSALLPALLYGALPEDATLVVAELSGPKPLFMIFFALFCHCANSKSYISCLTC
jgi:hypothetical protein